MTVRTTRSLRVAAIVAVLILALAGVVYGIRGIWGGTSPANQPPGTTAFHGIFQFTGNPHPENPAIQGGVLYYTWADLQPSPGFLDIPRIRADMRPWTAVHKRVAIRVMTSQRNGSATPDWVYASGVPAVRRTNGEVYPQYWNPHYLDALSSLAGGLAREFDADPAVAWVQAGVGIQGETKVEGINHGDARETAWTALGYTDELWFMTIQRIVHIYTAAFHRVPVAVSVDRSFIGGTPGYDENKVVRWLAANGLWPQDDGLRPTTHPTDAWTRGPHIEEQYLSAMKTGHALHDDLAAALTTKPNYILVYGTDIENPANGVELRRVAALAER